MKREIAVLIGVFSVCASTLCSGSTELVLYSCSPNANRLLEVAFPKVQRGEGAHACALNHCLVEPTFETFVEKRTKGQVFYQKRVLTPK